MWTFHQAGLIEDPTGRPCGWAYAGRGEGKNNRILEDIRAGCRVVGDDWVPVDGLSADDWGPLPQGIYTMRAPINTPSHGPYVLWLIPDESNNMYSRSGFGIHGDAIEHPGLASEGCICYARTGREAMWNSNDHRLQVIP